MFERIADAAHDLRHEILPPLSLGLFVSLFASGCVDNPVKPEDKCVSVKVPIGKTVSYDSVVAESPPFHIPYAIDYVSLTASIEYKGDSVGQKNESVIFWVARMGEPNETAIPFRVGGASCPVVKDSTGVQGVVKRYAGLAQQQPGKSDPLYEGDYRIVITHEIVEGCLGGEEQTGPNAVRVIEAEISGCRK